MSSEQVRQPSAPPPPAAMGSSTETDGPPERPMPPVPVTIVTGFLGSGKTTLLNYILTADHGKRIAVIENEFGDQVGVEKLIAKDGSGTDVDLDDLFVEVSNGCICCAVKDDLVTTIEALLRKRDRFDYILLETSGLADPGPLASIFWLDDDLQSQIFLDAVVTVVDGRNLERNLRMTASGEDQSQGESDKVESDRGDNNGDVTSKDGEAHKTERATADVVNEAHKQLAYADVVLLNKRDLVTEEQIQSIRSRVLGISPLTKVIETEYSKVPLESILDIKAFDAAAAQSTLTALNTVASEGEAEDGVEAGAADAQGHGHGHGHGRGDGSNNTLHPHTHDRSVKSVAFTVSPALDLSALNYWLGSLLWEHDIGVINADEADEADGDANGHNGGDGKVPSMDIFRIKGVVRAAGSDQAHVLQGVHDTFDVTESSFAFGSGPLQMTAPESRFVFIGRHLRRDLLIKGVESCVAQST